MMDRTDGQIFFYQKTLAKVYADKFRNVRAYQADSQIDIPLQ